MRAFNLINIKVNRLEDYLSSIYKTKARILFLGELGKKLKKPQEKLKAFGYGTPYLIEFNVKGETKRVVLETVRPDGFGHDHFSDRAQILLWQHSAFNKLPKHVHSIDVGAFTADKSVKSVGKCNEFFIITEAIEGKPYFRDLDRIKKEKNLTQVDKARCKALSHYLANIHATKKDAPQLYVRRIRDLVGQGEGIMGLCDSYPSGLKYIDYKRLCNIEKKSVEWRWRIKTSYTHRCSQVHGDFHPWNILFRKGEDFTVLDRSRGEWGDPADDLSAMSINYIFYSLLTYGKLQGPFKILFDIFWKTYLNKTGDTEVFRVIQPFYAWRGLVLASPIWYPKLNQTTRMKLLNFIRNMLEIDRVKLENINSYIEEG
jgi:hypothetical protein